MIIKKIVLCGFANVEKEISAKLHESSNLITEDGNLKRAIPLAIDFLLNPAYADTYLALQCRFPSIPEKNNVSYATLHISSVNEFDFKKKTGTDLIATRYASKNRVDWVYYTIGNFESKMTIEEFHAHLIPLHFLRIDDPVISQRTRPTSSDMNRMLVNGMNLNVALEDINIMLTLMNANEDTRNAALDIMGLELRACNEAKPHIIGYRKVEAALTTKFLNQTRERIEDFDSREQRELSLYMDVEVFDTIQSKRLIEYGKALREASEVIDRHQPIDMTMFKEHFDTFVTEWKTFMNDKKMARKIFAEVEEYNASVAMKRNLHYYFNKTEPIDKFIAICDKYIDAYKRGFNGIYQHAAWKRAQDMIQNTPKKMEALSKKVNDEVTKLKRCEEDSLKNELKRLRNMHKSLLCTNEMSLAQVSIGEFFQRQTILNPMHIEAWRAGFIVLGSPYRQKIQQDFVGNVLDFVSSNIIGGKELIDLLPHVIGRHFATFMFKTNESATTFLRVVSRSLISGCQVFATVTSKEAVKDLPFDSLADSLLTNDTCARFPHIKNWFDHFRVCTRNLNESQIQELAIKHKCTIILGRKSWDHNGHCVNVFNGKEIDELHAFLQKWHQVARHRDVIANMSTEKFRLDVQMEELKELQKMNGKQILEAKHTIMDLIADISNNMKDLLQVTNVHDDMMKKAIENMVQYTVYKEKKELLKAGDPHPPVELKEIPLIPETTMTPVIDAMKQFGLYSLNMVRDFAANVQTLHPDTIEEFKKGVEEQWKCYAELRKFDYKQQMNVAPVRSQEELKEWCAQVDEQCAMRTVLIEMDKCLMNKLMAIDAGTNLANNEVNILSKKPVAELFGLKREICANVPDHLITLDADLHEMDRWINHLAEELDIGLNDPNRDEITFDDDKMNVESHWIQTYLDCVKEILQLLNNVLGFEDETVGFELNCCGSEIHIFPDTEFHNDPFTLKSLCDIGTGLTFIGFIDNNTQTIVMSDFFDIKCHGFAMLFHLMLSLLANPWILVLSNTIIGQPEDQLRELLKRSQQWPNTEPPTGQARDNRQLIVVGRCSQAYDKLFEYLTISFKKF